MQVDLNGCNFDAMCWLKNGMGQLASQAYVFDSLNAKAVKDLQLRDLGLIEGLYKEDEYSLEEVR